MGQLDLWMKRVLKTLAPKNFHSRSFQAFFRNSQWVSRVLSSREEKGLIPNLRKKILENGRKPERKAIQRGTENACRGETKDRDKRTTEERQIERSQTINRLGREIFIFILSLASSTALLLLIQPITAGHQVVVLPSSRKFGNDRDTLIHIAWVKKEWWNPPCRSKWISFFSFYS